jgi:hypothetical protein
MMTPRRIMIMLLGFAGCIVAYFGYSVAFGNIDGLPQLPAKFLEVATGQAVVLNAPVSPTYMRLADAFGPNSEEVVDSNVYKNRVELRDKGLVLATGAPIFDNTEAVVVSPVSVALFAKPTTALKPGEAPEISTFHADKAILRFDRKISTLQDFHEKAKLKGIELVPNADLEGTDPRRGQIWITNNQRSKEENDKIVVRTAGRVFYQVPDETAPYDPNVAHVWTADPVEVVDRRNLPLTMRYDHNLPRAALARPDDLRRRGAIEGILMDRERPPPTVSAIGMQIYLKPEEKKPGEKKTAGGSSVRALVLREKVQMNLWSESGSGLPGTDAPAPEKASAKKAGPPSMPLIGLMGVALGGAAVAEQYAGKSLILVETPGSFRYDFEKTVAQFDVAAIPPPGGQPNLVSVTRLNALGGQDNLFCRQLTLEFTKPEPAAKPGTAPAREPERENALALRTMTAQGPDVYISVEAEGLVAQGNDLKYERFPEGTRSATTLKGTPVLADREGSRMQAGDKLTPGEVVIETLEPKPGAKGERTSTVLVKGAGRVEIHDKEQNRTTATASWGRQLRHEKVPVGDKFHDLLKFEGGGTFADQDGDFSLSANQIWLWLKADPTAKAKPADGKPSGATGTVPDRLEADGNVDGRSPEMKIKQTDKLFVAFRDIPPPKVVPVQPKDAPAPVVPGAQPPLAEVPAKVPEPEPAKAAEPAKETPNPIYLSASVIRTRVNRYPLPPDAEPPKPGGKKPQGGSLKYELENALCEERVEVEQAPDPKAETKAPLGLKIRGRKLNLDQSAAGSVMVVYGTDAAPGEVHFETSSLYGPQVEIDQPNNTVKVFGRGKLRMLSGADFNRNESSTPSDLEITWAKEMKFDGAKSYAEFVQNVTATQISRPDPVGNGVKIERPGAAEVLPPPKPLGEPNQYTTRSTLQSFRLDITFDRPIYFSQLRDERATKPKPATGAGKAKGKEDDRPKLRTAVCTPIPEDERANFPGTPTRDVYFVEEVFDGNAKYVRARRLRAKQIDFDNREKEQILIANGEGELRLLQYDNNDGEPAKPSDPKAEPPEMKLTWVTFGTRMVARDKGKLYQEAKFDDGANVVQVPTTDLNLDIQLHALPKKALRLSCRDSMVVSSSKTKPDAPATQWLTALGNAEFWNDTYQGNGGKVTYDSSKVVLDGTPTRLASLYGRERSPNQTNFHQAEQIIYHKDGRIELKKSAGGSITPGGR